MRTKQQCGRRRKWRHRLSLCLKNTLFARPPQGQSFNNAYIRSDCRKLERTRFLCPLATSRGDQNSAPTTSHETYVYISFNAIPWIPSQNAHSPASLINIQIFQGHNGTTTTPPFKSLARNSAHHPPQRPWCIHLLLHPLFYPSVPYSSSDSSDSIVQICYLSQCLGWDVGASWGGIYINAHLRYQSPV